MIPQFKPGDVFFLMHHDNWISKALAFFMRSKWSHGFIVIEQTSQFCYILETSDFEVVIADLDRYIADPNTSMEAYRFSDLSDQDAIEMMKYAVNANLGIVYGYLQLISLAIRCMFKWVGIKIPNFIQQGLVCDENVIIALKDKLPEFAKIPPKSIDTEDLYQMVKALPTVSQIYSK